MARTPQWPLVAQDVLGCPALVGRLVLKWRKQCMPGAGLFKQAAKYSVDWEQSKGV